MIPRDKICCFTGHRNLPARMLPDLKRRLADAIELLIGQGVCCFAAGGARGFDALAAREVLKKRERYPHIKLILVLPFEGQEASWREEDRQEFWAIRRRADKVAVLAPKYEQGCYFVRNRRLVEESGICLCYLTRERSGTGMTVRYAKGQGLWVLNLAER